ncbi:MAG: hypothetical protein HOO90_00995 [Methylotenera sp.]|uniref:hypothetical protein n=1 Tax=Methylotenera sp. TaxID=2051956 RepID=UPI001807550F|nr:hypothetical protein [Methylotenera sp.]NOU24092.1 hypothetical protein [Methylotenera sp.]
MSDVCIHENGQIVLFSLVGCSTGKNDPNDKMYGLWELANGKKEMVCWKYDNMILVYTLDKRVLAFTPDQQDTECPLHPSSEPYSTPETKSPAEYHEPLNG